LSRWWLLIIGVLIFGGLFGTLMLTDPGYVLISWADFAFETSLWFGLLLVLAAWFSIRLLVMLGRLTRRSMTKVVGFGAERRAHKARVATGRGLLLWAEGDWRESRRLLAESAPHSEFPLINHLFAADSSRQLGDLHEQERHLKEAVVAEPAGEFAVSLTRAGYLLSGGQTAEALSLLKLLHAKAPKHPMVARRLLACAEAAGEYVLAQEMLESSAMRGVFDESIVRDKRRALWLGRIRTDPSDVSWNEVPAALRQDVDAINARIDQLLSGGHAGRVMELIDSSLRQQWSPDLVRRFGMLSGVDHRSLLQRAESWLAKHQDDAALLLILGRLTRKIGDLDKAESFLKPLLKGAPEPEVAAEIGRLYLQRGDHTRAAALFEQALPRG
jgi:HemY protein